MVDVDAPDNGHSKIWGLSLLIGSRQRFRWHVEQELFPILKFWAFSFGSFALPCSCASMFSRFRVLSSCFDYFYPIGSIADECVIVFREKSLRDIHIIASVATASPS